MTIKQLITYRIIISNAGYLSFRFMSDNSDFFIDKSLIDLDIASYGVYSIRVFNNWNKIIDRRFLENKLK